MPPTLPLLLLLTLQLPAAAVDFVQLFKQGVDAPACIRNPLLVQVPGGPLIVFAGAHQFSCE